MCTNCLKLKLWSMAAVVFLIIVPGGFACITENLTYPHDALAHARHIHEEFRRVFPNVRPHRTDFYRGPWIENYWVNTHMPLLLNATDLRKDFGRFVPLLIPWVDVWVKNRYRYPEKFVRLMTGLLRPDVPYVTVSQNADGITGRCEFPFMRNILVISSGGVGHVAIPLLANSLDLPEHREKSGVRLSFLGAVRSIRTPMCRIAQRFAESRGLRAELCVKKPQWHSAIARASIGLCPRGYGRTSYRLSETIQLGTVPWYIYDDVEWIPYRDLWPSLGFSSQIDDFEEDLRRWNNSEQVLAAKEANVLKYRDSHFTSVGVMQQIRRFLLSPATSDLRCQPYPPVMEVTSRTMRCRAGKGGATRPKPPAA